MKHREAQSVPGGNGADVSCAIAIRMVFPFSRFVAPAYHLSNVKIEKRGLSPTGSGIQQVDPLMFAGFLVILASLKFLVLFDWKRGKEMPMRKAFMCGVRSVSETFWTIGVSSITAILPG